MSHRTFVDDTNRAWEVWEVFPDVVERRLNDERRRAPRATPDRRRHVDIRFRMAPELRDGWLAFQSGAERKRLAPIPRGWEVLSDGELAELAHRASPQPALIVPPPGGPASAESAAPPRADRTPS